MKKYVYFVLLFIIISCGSKQLRFQFDKEEVAIKTCDDNKIIRELTIYECGSCDIGYEIYLTDENKASSIIYLEKANIGYQTSDKKSFRFKANKKYTITSTFLDSEAEMILFTNQNAEVDSVINEYSCFE
ncbi:MAG: hypothetical protein N4A72_05915 [Bacteroidales bacterium]|jgi:hypothetical protein|nr:hypothetical protein [Bacteroidales bacterium]